jgi:BirA family biotin operon repressor/biotin-[acetyl-CoA-carboxylase] ligase
MKTLFVGQNLIHLESVDSTNSYAVELLRTNKLNEGAVISTFNQTKGRGQRGNTWDSEPNKNVSLSIVLYPSFLHPEKQFLLSKTIALGIYDLMTEILGFSAENKHLKIKWPNDIYFENKKIAGILIENTLSDGCIKASIVGIGINVNQTMFNNQPNATSISLIKKQMIDLNAFIEKLCEHIEARYLQLKANKKEVLDNDYLKHLYQYGKWNKYVATDEAFKGKILGVSDNGKLQLTNVNGQIREFSMKEVQFL